jgi:biofilm PGA synthesis N-glycosyltransferase PgaC
MRALFWGSAFLIVYVYAGYPALLAIWARLAGRRRAPSFDRRDEGTWPGVSIIVAARNEASRLDARLENLLSLDYPADRRQIVVVSDGSTDATPAVLQRFHHRIDAIVVPAGGKASALNAGVERARHEVLVFADARQTFAPDALRALVGPLADPRIGGVTGELVLGCESTAGRRGGLDRRDADPVPASSSERRASNDRRTHAASAISEGVGLYWRYEKALRRMESAVGSTLGATGAIYALRRSLWKPLPADTLLDDVLAPMRAVVAGRRMIFDDRATAFDYTPSGSLSEAQRKIRTLAGNFQLLWLEPRLLVPFVNPVWVQFVSHKLGRLFVPYALLGLLAASIALANQHPFFLVALLCQCALYLLAGYGAWIELRNAEAEGKPSRTAPETALATRSSGAAPRNGSSRGIWGWGPTRVSPDA